MQQKVPELYLLSPCLDGKKFDVDEIATHTPIPRIRQILGGSLSDKREYTPEISAYFNGKRRVLVMRFKPGCTRDEADRILKNITEEREDLS